MRATEPHPYYQAFLDETADAPAFNEIPVEDARAVSEDVFAVEESTPVGDVSNRTIDGSGGEIPIRIYTPEGDGPFPVAMFFHGGGFISGSLDSHDEFCRVLTNEVEAIFVSVGYRLAPEHKYPAAIEDSYAATEWVAGNAGEFGGDADRLIVVGDSAGGNVAAAVSQMARDRDGPEIDYQVLLYPATSQDGRQFESYEENGEGYFIETPDLEYFQDLYFEDDEDASEPYASPINADDLSGLPPATVATGGFDPLRDEGVAYAEALAEAGVDVSHHHYDDAIHIFVQMAAAPFAFEPSQEALDDVVDDIRAAIH